MHNQATLTSYITGFVLSVALTLTAFFLAVHPEYFHAGTNAIIIGILALAAVQLFVQLAFFMHLGSEKGPRWNLGMLISTFGIIFIIVAGSLWIMAHLNYNMMPDQMNSYLLQQEGF